MSFRSHLERLADQNKLTQIDVPISAQYEIAGLLKQLEPAAVLCTQVINTPFGVAGNLFCTKADFANYFRRFNQ